MTHVPPEREDKARALFGDLIAGPWERAHQEFDVRMRGHADAERLARGWTRVADRAGSFERTGALSARQSGDYTVMDVRLTSRRVKQSDGWSSTVTVKSLACRWNILTDLGETQGQSKVSCSGPLR